MTNERKPVNMLCVHCGYEIEAAPFSWHDTGWVHINTQKWSRDKTNGSCVGRAVPYLLTRKCTPQQLDPKEIERRRKQ